MGKNVNTVPKVANVLFLSPNQVLVAGGGEGG